MGKTMTAEKKRERKPRSIRDHERYMEQREERKARQRAYYEAHRDELNARRRQRDSEKTVEKLRAIYSQMK